MNPRRYHRTMKEAFGPYTSDELQPMEPDSHLVVWVYWLARLVGLAVVLFWFI